VRLVSFRGGFGRVEDAQLVPMGTDIVAYLAGDPAREEPPLALDSVTLLAPVPEPRKVIGVGRNYREHARELGSDIPEEPVLFAKFATSVVGPAEPILIPHPAKQVDYEAELGVVIGTTAREVTTEAALDHVAG
jgi:2-keto-4-pentenoate hydratase/2-oxohepta-3-ene-1,7-dioic acid hydratase in catechol pathway